MDYKQFIQGYKTNKEKEKYAEKHIARKYVPYSEKLSEALKIADISTHTEINDKMVYKKNTPNQYFFTTLRLVLMYSDITAENEDIVSMYDALSEIGALDTLLSLIPESEVTMFRALVEMCVNDIYENEHDTVSFLERKSDTISIVFNQIFDALAETLSTVDVEQIVKDKIKEFPQKERQTGDESKE